MEAVEFCEMRHGYCACAKAGEVHCLQILRLVKDPVEIEKAQAERDAADRKRRSRYIVDDPAPGDAYQWIHVPQQREDCVH